MENIEFSKFVFLRSDTYMGVYTLHVAFSTVSDCSKIYVIKQRKISLFCTVINKFLTD